MGLIDTFYLYEFHFSDFDDAHTYCLLRKGNTMGATSGKIDDLTFAFFWGMKTEKITEEKELLPI